MGTERQESLRRICPKRRTTEESLVQGNEDDEEARPGLSQEIENLMIKLKFSTHSLSPQDILNCFFARERKLVRGLTTEMKLLIHDFIEALKDRDHEFRFAFGSRSPLPLWIKTKNELDEEVRKTLRDIEAAKKELGCVRAELKKLEDALNDDESIEEKTYQRLKFLEEKLYERSIERSAIFNSAQELGVEVAGELRNMALFCKDFEALKCDYLEEISILEENFTNKLEDMYDKMEGKLEHIVFIQNLLPQLYTSYREKVRRKWYKLGEMKDAAQFQLMKSRERRVFLRPSKYSSFLQRAKSCERELWKRAKILMDLRTLLDLQQGDITDIIDEIKRQHIEKFDISLFLTILKNQMDELTPAIKDLKESQDNVMVQFKQFNVKDANFLVDIERDIYMLNFKKKTYDYRIKKTVCVTRLFLKYYKRLFSLLQIAHTRVPPFFQYHVKTLDYSTYEFLVTEMKRQMCALMCKLYYYESHYPISDRPLEVGIFRRVPIKRYRKRIRDKGISLERIATVLENAPKPVTRFMAKEQLKKVVFKGRKSLRKGSIGGSGSCGPFDARKERKLIASC